MATRPKAIIESRNGEKFSPITIAKNVLTDDGQNLHDILSNRKEDMMTPTIENSSSMFKVGQGDNVDYSSNIVNGAYESMVLKGKTMVNCIQEPSSQDVVLPYAFNEGQYVTINDTKESGTLGVELKGQTLVNLIEDDTREGVTLTASNKDLTLLYTLKPSTQYTLLINIVSTNNDHSNDWWCGLLKTGNWGSESRSYVKGINKLLFTTQADSDCSKLRVRGMGTTFKDAILLEGDWTNIDDTPYFTGMASCKMPILHTVGKNLFDLSNASNGFLSMDKPYILQSPDQNNKTSAYIKVKPNTKYSYSFDGFTPSQVGGMYWTGFYYYKRIGEVSAVHPSRMTFTSNSEANKQITFTTPSDCNYIRIGSRGLMLSGATAQLEEATSATAYEPYKSSILSLPEEVVLRSLPNGVCDTYNVQTGEYVQNIGEVMFDGSNDEDWFLNSETGFTNKRFRTIILNGKMAKHIYEAIDMKIDRIACYPNSSWNNDREGAERDSTYLSFRKNIETIGEFKQWLSQNPVTVQYPLKTPIITKIPLSQVLKSWNTTTHIYSEIPENTLYPTLTHSNPTYPVILKPSAKYSIVANSYSNGHTNSAINFNLGGATASTTVGNRVTTITTPSTLSNELLTMSGRGNKLNNVMVIEGEVVGDESYFEGICDCKSPILSNVGKNLYPVTYLTDNAYVDKIRLKANTRYTLKNSVAFSPQNRFKFRVYDLKHNPLDDGNLMTKDKDLYYNSGSKAFCNNGNKDYIECSFTPRIDCYISITSFNSGINPNQDYHIQLEEGSSATSYEPYKSNILSVNGDKIELTEDMFEQGSLFYDNNTFEQAKSFANDDTGTRSIRIRTKKLIKVKPNTTYRFSYKNSCQSWFYGYDMNENPTNCKSAIVGVTEQVFTTNSSTHYIALVLFKTGNPTITPSNYDYKSIQIAEVDKTIVLRSLPNGVCDTLNVETGEYVQRIGETVLDGSDDENWGINNTEGTTTNRFISQSLQNSNVDQSTGVGQFLCDKLKTEVWNQTSRLGLTINGRDVFIYNASIDYSASAIKQWLSQNPVTIQYELETPIVKTINLSGYPFSYEKGHVILSSGSIEQSLTPKVEYSVVTNRNGQIRSNQKMVERHQKQLDRLQAMILTNLVNTQYEQTLTNLKYDLKNVREEVK